MGVKVSRSLFKYSKNIQNWYFRDEKRKWAKQYLYNNFLDMLTPIKGYILKRVRAKLHKRKAGRKKWVTEERNDYIQCTILPFGQ